MGLIFRRLPACLNRRHQCLLREKPLAVIRGQIPAKQSALSRLTFPRSRVMRELFSVFGSKLIHRCLFLTVPLLKAKLIAEFQTIAIEFCPMGIAIVTITHAHPLFVYSVLASNWFGLNSRHFWRLDIRPIRLYLPIFSGLRGKTIGEFSPWKYLN